MPPIRFRSPVRRPVSRRSAHLAWVFGPVTIAAAVAIAIALHALPLAGSARLVLAVTVGLDVWLLALACWTGILGVVTGIENASDPTLH